MFKHSEKQPGIDAVMLDFVHVMVDMIKFNTPFLNVFWNNSPVPEFNGGANIGFWLIYILIFVGIALQASGARMWRQARHIKEGIEDQMIWNRRRAAKGAHGRSWKKIHVPRHTILLQIFRCTFCRGSSPWPVTSC